QTCALPIWRSGTPRWRSWRAAAQTTLTRHVSLDRLCRNGERCPLPPVWGDPCARQSEELGRSGLGISDGTREQVEWTGGGADLAGGDPEVSGRGCQTAVAQQQLDGADIRSRFQ